jgi:hypothetical protein
MVVVAAGSVGDVDVHFANRIDRHGILLSMNGFEEGAQGFLEKNEPLVGCGCSLLKSDFKALHFVARWPTVLGSVLSSAYPAL